MTRLVGEYLYTQKLNTDRQNVQELAQALSAPLAAHDAEALYALIDDQSSRLAGRILVTDGSGHVLFDAYSELNGLVMDSREVAAALQEGDTAGGYYMVRQDGRQTLMFISAHPIPGETKGAAVLITLGQELYQSLLRVWLRMLFWVVLVCTVVFVITLLITRHVTRPVNAMNEVITAMTRGNLSLRIKYRGKNEFAQLAQSFNVMCEQLESLDKSRSQFVSNASHELKTPLSTMKILIETMLYQDGLDEAVCKEFLGDINKEIDRLSSIISDLLTLVKMDDGEMKLARESVVLNELLEENVKRLAPLARERGIEMKLVMREPITVPGDTARLTQVFYNLIDNAVKYTPRGGRVRVELTRSGRSAIVRVIDTGIGIPKEAQMHIFDRFYRVDKARSRETGGTGLGLSIVKQIVLLHGGTISLTSEEEKGSTFTVELPSSAG